MPRYLNDFYFAYGSNLNLDDLSSWCLRRFGQDHTLKFAGEACLPDYELAFTRMSVNRGAGVLDIRECPGSFVQGVLFQVTASDRRYLDRKEGAAGASARGSSPRSQAYRRTNLLAFDDMNRPIDIFTYEVVDKEAFVAPSIEYLEVVSNGYQRFGLSTQPLLDAANNKPGACEPMGLFVYGTLKTGQKRHWALRNNVEFSIEAGTIGGTLYDLGDFPGLKASANHQQGRIEGEILISGELSNLILRADLIEGFYGLGAQSNLFDRVLASVETSTGERGRVWVYEFAGSIENAHRIVSGSWPVIGSETEYDDVAGPPLSECSVGWRASKRVENDLLVLAEDLTAHDYDLLSLLDVTEPWYGADVIVVDDQKMANQAEHMSQKTFIVTQHELHASAVLTALRDSVGDFLDFSNKYDFYESVADAANVEIARHGDRRCGIAVSMVRAAYEFFGFRRFPVKAL